MTEAEKRILVVDDDDAIRALLFTVLRRRGFKVDTAKHGSEAVERCSKCSYSVVLLDLMMPVMSGYDFLDAVANQPAEERPLVIVLTAGALPRHLHPDIVSASLRKPFDIELLVDTVNACISASVEKMQREGCGAADSDEAPSDFAPQKGAN